VAAQVPAGDGATGPRQACGEVEVDESYISVAPGKHGRGAEKKDAGVDRRREARPRHGQRPLPRMYLGDRGGSGLSLYALEPKSDMFGNFSYPWGDVTYASMPPVIYQNLQVMTLGAQYSQAYSVVQPPAVCNSILY
jgi:hypothetical protein